MLENFANVSSPANPLAGQIWWDTSNSRIKVYTGTDWTTGGGPIVQPTQPTMVAGDMWINNDANQLYFFDGTDLELAGPIYNAFQGKSGPEVITVLDQTGTSRTIVKYWVGGTGTWDATTTTNWSATSGGAGGASAPTLADNVIFNSASNATLYTVTVGTNAVALDVTVAGPASGNVTFSLGATAVINCYGSFTLAATGITWTGVTTAVVNFRATTTGKTITTNGVSLASTGMVFDGVGGGWTLGSALTATASIIVTNGSFNSGNYNITYGGISSSSSNIRSITLGSSTVTLTGTAVLTFTTATNLTFNAGTSQITCSGNSATFSGGGRTFYEVLDGVNIFNIERVEVIRRLVPMYGDLGRNGVISIILKSGDQIEKERNNFTLLKLKGFAPYLSFEEAEATRQSLPFLRPFRPTLFWNPSITNDGSRLSIPIEFWLNEKEGPILVEVRGITELGEPIYGTFLLNESLTRLPLEK